MKFSYKVFSHGNDTLLAIADESILGKTFTENELTITVSDFYRDKTCDRTEALKLIREATIVNAVGRDIVELLVKENLADRNSVLKIGGVPHVQIVSLK